MLKSSRADRRKKFAGVPIKIPGIQKLVVLIKIMFGRKCVGIQLYEPFLDRIPEVRTPRVHSPGME